MKILMVGASGRYARYVLPALKARGATVRALVTSADKVSAAMADGVDETAIGNLNDKESLSQAAHG